MIPSLTGRVSVLTNVSLPASPLWLAGLYAPQMATVNAYFPPPMWFAVSIFLMEVFTIVFPIIQVLKAESLRQETLDALSKWERQQELKKGQDSVSGSESRSNKSSNYTGTTLSMDEQLGPTKYTTLELQSTDMLNMIALENTLRVNPEPLLQFAALKDFSGENVSFLTHVAEWKRAWFVPLRSTKEQRERQFMDAVRIYACFVSLIFAPFPINISSRELDRLRDLFEGKAERLMRRTSSYAGSSDTITPFDLELTETASTTEFKSGADLDKFGRAKLKSASGMAEFVTGRESPIDGIEVPEAFTADVFESAEREIKYLIFTNTWPKFVGASCASSDSEVKEAGRARWWARATLCNV